MPATTKKQGGALFDIGSNEAAEIQQLLETYHPALNKKFVNFLDALGRACHELKTDQIDAVRLSDFAQISKSTIDVYAEKLTQRGYFFKSTIRRAGKGRRPNLYTLNELDIIQNVDDLDWLPSDSLLIRNNKGKDENQLGLFKEADLPAPPEIQDLIVPGNPLKGDILSIYTFLSALRLAKSGERTEGSYTADIYINDRDRMQIHVSAHDGYKVAGIIDTKALVALTTMARSYYSPIYNPEPGSGVTLRDLVPNTPMIMDMAELLSILQSGSSGGEKEQAWKMILAWRHTDFTVLKATKVIRELFGDNYIKHESFSFITRLETIQSKNENSPERFAIWFDPEFLLRVLHVDSKFVSSITSQIMRESSASVLLVYYWCRRAIQYHCDPESAKPFKLTELKKQMANYMYNSSFKRILEAVCKKTQCGESTFNILGYRLERWSETILQEDGSEKEEDFFKFWLDKNDSLYQARLRYQNAPAIVS